MNKNLEKNIKIYYVFNFAKNLTFTLPIFALYFEQIGLSYFHILLVFGLQSFLQVIFEVPSGVMADKLGRKKVLVIYAFLRTTSFLFFVLASGLSFIIIGCMLLGLALAFESGTDSAFIFDTLKTLGREDEYKRVEGKAFSLSLAGWGVASFFGGFLAEYSLQLPFLVTSIILLPLPFISFLFVEPSHYKESGDTEYFAHIVDAAKYAATHPRVKLLILFSSTLIIGMLCVFPIMQPYMKKAGIPLKFFGPVYCLWLFASALGSRFADRIHSKIGEIPSLILMLLVTSFPLVFMGLKPITFVWFVFLPVEFVFGFIRPVINDEINKLVESHQRATILSLKGFSHNILYMIIAPIAGYYADLYSIHETFFIEGVIILLAGVFIIFRIHVWNGKLSGK